MKKIELAWKSINIDLEAVNEKLKVDFPETYKGNQAASCLELWFSELPDEAGQQAIIDYWNDLDAESPEALSYRTNAQIEQAVKDMKAAIPAKTWANMSQIERALLIGVQPTKQQLIDEEWL